MPSEHSHQICLFTTRLTHRFLFVYRSAHWKFVPAVSTTPVIKLPCSRITANPRQQKLHSWNTSRMARQRSYGKTGVNAGVYYSRASIRLCDRISTVIPNVCVGPQNWTF